MLLNNASLSFLNKAMIFFTILSSVGPLLILIAVILSSLHSPTFFLPTNLDNFSRSHKPTSSQILTLSKLPIFTSNNVSFSSFFFSKSRLCQKVMILLQKFIALMTLSSISLKDLAFSMDLFKRFSEMGGLNSMILKFNDFTLMFILVNYCR